MTGPHRNWIVLVKACISLTLLAILIYTINWQQLTDAFKALSPWLLVGGVGVYLVGQWLCAAKWAILARELNINTSLQPCFELYLIGMFLSLFLPSSFGGDLGRTWLLAKRSQSSKTSAFLSVFAERLTGLCILLGITAVGMLFLTSIIPFWVAGLFVLVTIGCLGACFFVPTLIRLKQVFRSRRLIKQESLDPASSSLRFSTSAVWQALLLSVVFHGICIGLHWVWLNALGQVPSFTLLMTVYGLCGLSGLLPLTINGIGLREGAAVAMLVQWGHLPEGIAAAYSLVWLSVLLLAALPGGFLLAKKPVLIHPERI